MKHQLSRVPWVALLFGFLLIYPFVPVLESTVSDIANRSMGNEMTTLFIFAILALALNVVVGYTGLLHLGIAAFFGIGAYICGILMVPSYPFQWSLWPTLVAAGVGAGLLGFLLSAPTLRLRGDYLALVTLGFGEVTRFTLRNLDQITAGKQGLNPIDPPTFTASLGNSAWNGKDQFFYLLALIVLVIVYIVLRNLERSRLGRALVAIREDELAATCMGLNAARLKLLAFSLGAGLAGLAGCLYAANLTTTAEPDTYGFNRSITVLCCLILGGLGSRNGVLLGVFLILGFDNILSPIVDGYLQNRFREAGIDTSQRVYLTFNGWRLMLFGLALILVMRYRPEGLLPSERIRHELHPEQPVNVRSSE